MFRRESSPIGVGKNSQIRWEEIFSPNAATPDSHRIAAPDVFQSFGALNDSSTSFEVSTLFHSNQEQAASRDQSLSQVFILNAARLQGNEIFEGFRNISQEVASGQDEIIRGTYGDLNQDLLAARDPLAASEISLSDDEATRLISAHASQIHSRNVTVGLAVSLVEAHLAWINSHDDLLFAQETQRRLEQCVWLLMHNDAVRRPDELSLAPEFPRLRELVISKARNLYTRVPSWVREVQERKKIAARQILENLHSTTAGSINTIQEAFSLWRVFELRRAQGATPSELFEILHRLTRLIPGESRAEFGAQGLVQAARTEHLEAQDEQALLLVLAQAYDQVLTASSASNSNGAEREEAGLRGDLTFILLPRLFSQAQALAPQNPLAALGLYAQIAESVNRHSPATISLWTRTYGNLPAQMQILERQIFSHLPPFRELGARVSQLRVLAEAAKARGDLAASHFYLEQLLNLASPTRLFRPSRSEQRMVLGLWASAQVRLGFGAELRARLRSSNFGRIFSRNLAGAEQFLNLGQVLAEEGEREGTREVFKILQERYLPRWGLQERLSLYPGLVRLSEAVAGVRPSAEDRLSLQNLKNRWLHDLRNSSGALQTQSALSLVQQTPDLGIAFDLVEEFLSDLHPFSSPSLSLEQRLSQVRALETALLRIASQARQRFEAGAPEENWGRVYNQALDQLHQVYREWQTWNYSAASSNRPGERLQSLREILGFEFRLRTALGAEATHGWLAERVHQKTSRDLLSDALTTPHASTNDFLESLQYFTEQNIAFETQAVLAAFRTRIDTLSLDQRFCLIQTLHQSRNQIQNKLSEHRRLGITADTRTQDESLSQLQEEFHQMTLELWEAIEHEAQNPPQVQGQQRAQPAPLLALHARAMHLQEEGKEAEALSVLQNLVAEAERHPPTAEREMRLLGVARAVIRAATTSHFSNVTEVVNTLLEGRRRGASQEYNARERAQERQEIEEDLIGLRNFLHRLSEAHLPLTFETALNQMEAESGCNPSALRLRNRLQSLGPAVWDIVLALDRDLNLRSNRQILRRAILSLVDQDASYRLGSGEYQEGIIQALNLLRQYSSEEEKQELRTWEYRIQGAEEVGAFVRRIYSGETLFALSMMVLTSGLAGAAEAAIIPLIQSSYAGILFEGLSAVEWANMGIALNGTVRAAALIPRVFGGAGNIGAFWGSNGLIDVGRGGHFEDIRITAVDIGVISNVMPYFSTWGAIPRAFVASLVMPITGSIRYGIDLLKEGETLESIWDVYSFMESAAMGLGQEAGSHGMARVQGHAEPSRRQQRQHVEAQARRIERILRRETPLSQDPTGGASSPRGTEHPYRSAAKPEDSVGANNHLPLHDSPIEIALLGLAESGVFDQLSDAQARWISEEARRARENGQIPLEEVSRYVERLAEGLLRGIRPEILRQNPHLSLEDLIGEEQRRRIESLKEQQNIVFQAAMEEAERAQAQRIHEENQTRDLDQEFFTSIDWETLQKWHVQDQLQEPHRPTRLERLLYLSDAWRTQNFRGRIRLQEFLRLQGLEERDIPQLEIIDTEGELVEERRVVEEEAVESEVAHDSSVVQPHFLPAPRLQLEAQASSWRESEPVSTPRAENDLVVVAEVEGEVVEVSHTPELSSPRLEVIQGMSPAEANLRDRLRTASFFSANDNSLDLSAPAQRVAHSDILPDAVSSQGPNVAAQHEAQALGFRDQQRFRASANDDGKDPSVRPAAAPGERQSDGEGSPRRDRSSPPEGMKLDETQARVSALWRNIQHFEAEIENLGPREELRSTGLEALRIYEERIAYYRLERDLLLIENYLLRGVSGKILNFESLTPEELQPHCDAAMKLSNPIPGHALAYEIEARRLSREISSPEEGVAQILALRQEGVELFWRDEVNEARHRFAVAGILERRLNAAQVLEFSPKPAPNSPERNQSIEVRLLCGLRLRLRLAEQFPGLVVEEGSQGVAASFVGFGLSSQQDRVSLIADSRMALVADGVGGSRDGALGAEVVTQTYALLIEAGFAPRVAAFLADEAALRAHAVRYPQETGLHSSAVLVAGHVWETGPRAREYEMLVVGDSGGLVLRLHPSGEIEALHVEEGRGIGRLPEQTLGEEYRRSLNPHQKRLPLRGDEFEILFSDALKKLFNVLKNDLQVLDVADLLQVIRESGARDESEIHQVIWREGLARQRLLDQLHAGSANTVLLTAELYAAAYREVSGNIDPPLASKYQGHTLRKASHGRVGVLNPSGEVVALWEPDNFSLSVRHLAPELLPFPVRVAREITPRASVENLDFELGLTRRELSGAADFARSASDRYLTESAQAHAELLRVDQRAQEIERARLQLMREVDPGRSFGLSDLQQMLRNLVNTWGEDSPRAVALGLEIRARQILAQENALVNLETLIVQTRTQAFQLLREEKFNQAGFYFALATRLELRRPAALLEPLPPLPSDRAQIVFSLTSTSASHAIYLARGVLLHFERGASGPWRVRAEGNTEPIEVLDSYGNPVKADGKNRHLPLWRAEEAPSLRLMNGDLAPVWPGDRYQISGVPPLEFMPLEGVEGHELRLPGGVRLSLRPVLGEAALTQHLVGERWAAGSVAGFGEFHNDDRVRASSDGRWMVVADGISGENFGDLAAEIFSAAFLALVQQGYAPRDAVFLADLAVVQWGKLYLGYPLERLHAGPGTVMTATELVLTKPGRYRLTRYTVGDCGDCVFAPASVYRAREVFFEHAGYESPGQRNRPEDYLGVPRGKHLNLHIEVVENLPAGSVHLSFSDGILKVFGSLQELMSFVEQLGPRTADEIQQAILIEAQVRQYLARMAERNAAQFMVLTPREYAEAYFVVTGKTISSNWPAFQYERHTLDSDGMLYNLAGESVGEWWTDNLSVGVRVIGKTHAGIDPTPIERARYTLQSALARLRNGVANLTRAEREALGLELAPANEVELSPEAPARVARVAGQDFEPDSPLPFIKGGREGFSSDNDNDLRAVASKGGKKGGKREVRDARFRHREVRQPPPALPVTEPRQALQASVTPTPPVDPAFAAARAAESQRRPADRAWLERLLSDRDLLACIEERRQVSETERLGSANLALTEDEGLRVPSNFGLDAPILRYLLGENSPLPRRENLKVFGVGVGIQQICADSPTLYSFLGHEPLVAAALLTKGPVRYIDLLGNVVEVGQYCLERAYTWLNVGISRTGIGILREGSLQRGFPFDAEGLDRDFKWLISALEARRLIDKRRTSSVDGEVLGISIPEEIASRIQLEHADWVTLAHPNLPREADLLFLNNIYLSFKENPRLLAFALLRLVRDNPGAVLVLTCKPDSDFDRMLNALGLTPLFEFMGGGVVGDVSRVYKIEGLQISEEWRRRVEELERALGLTEERVEEVRERRGGADAEARQDSEERRENNGRDDLTQPSQLAPVVIAPAVREVRGSIEWLREILDPVGIVPLLRARAAESPEQALGRVNTPAAIATIAADFAAAGVEFSSIVMRAPTYFAQLAPVLRWMVRDNASPWKGKDPPQHVVGVGIGVGLNSAGLGVEPRAGTEPVMVMSALQARRVTYFDLLQAVVDLATAAARTGRFESLDDSVGHTYLKDPQMRVDPKRFAEDVKWLVDELKDLELLKMEQGVARITLPERLRSRLHFKQGDVVNAEFPRSNGFVIANVLHYLERHSPQLIPFAILRIVFSIEPGGFLIIGCREGEAAHQTLQALGLQPVYRTPCSQFYLDDIFVYQIPTEGLRIPEEWRRRVEELERALGLTSERVEEVRERRGGADAEARQDSGERGEQNREEAPPPRPTRNFDETPLSQALEGTDPAAAIRELEAYRGRAYMRPAEKISRAESLAVVVLGLEHPTPEVRTSALAVLTALSAGMGNHLPPLIQIEIAARLEDRISRVEGEEKAKLQKARAAFKVDPAKVAARVAELAAERPQSIEPVVSNPAPLEGVRDASVETPPEAPAVRAARIEGLVQTVSNTYRTYRNPDQILASLEAALRGEDIEQGLAHLEAFRRLARLSPDRMPEFGAIALAELGLAHTNTELRDRAIAVLLELSSFLAGRISLEERRLRIAVAALYLFETRADLPQPTRLNLIQISGAMKVSAPRAKALLAERLAADQGAVRRVEEASASFPAFTPADASFAALNVGSEVFAELGRLGFPLYSRALAAEPRLTGLSQMGQVTWALSSFFKGKFGELTLADLDRMRGVLARADYLNWYCDVAQAYMGRQEDDLWLVPSFILYTRELSEALSAFIVREASSGRRLVAELAAADGNLAFDHLAARLSPHGIGITASDLSPIGEHATRMQLRDAAEVARESDVLVAAWMGVREDLDRNPNPYDARVAKIIAADPSKVLIVITQGPDGILNSTRFWEIARDRLTAETPRELNFTPDGRPLALTSAFPFLEDTSAAQMRVMVFRAKRRGGARTTEERILTEAEALRLVEGDLLQDDETVRTPAIRALHAFVRDHAAEISPSARLEIAARVELAFPVLELSREEASLLREIDEVLDVDSNSVVRRANALLQAQRIESSLSGHVTNAALSPDNIPFLDLATVTPAQLRERWRQGGFPDQAPAQVTPETIERALSAYLERGGHTRTFLRYALSHAFRGTAHGAFYLALAEYALDCLGWKWGRALRFYQEEKNPYARWVYDEVARRGGRVYFDEMYDLCMRGEKGVYTDLGTTGIVGTSGVSGHFDTSAREPWYARLRAMTAYEVWIEQGRPQRFNFEETGAGEGDFADHFLGFVREQSQNNTDWANFAAALRYLILEQSLELSRRQNLKLAKYGEQAQSFAVSDLDGAHLPPYQVNMSFSNERLDMLSPRKIVRRGEGYYETAVSNRGGLLQEELVPLRAETAEYLRRNPVELEEGEVFYVQPSLVQWLQLRRNRLVPGGVLIAVDYGQSRSVLLDVQKEGVPLFRGYAGGDKERAHFDIQTAKLLPALKPKAIRGKHVLDFGITEIEGPADMTVDVDTDALQLESNRAGFEVVSLRGQKEYVRESIRNHGWSLDGPEGERLRELADYEAERREEILGRTAMISDMFQITLRVPQESETPGSGRSFNQDGSSPHHLNPPLALAHDLSVRAQAQVANDVDLSPEAPVRVARVAGQDFELEIPPFVGGQEGFVSANNDNDLSFRASLPGDGEKPIHRIEVVREREVLSTVLPVADPAWPVDAPQLLAYLGFQSSILFASRISQSAAWQTHASQARETCWRAFELALAQAAAQRRRIERVLIQGAGLGHDSPVQRILDAGVREVVLEDVDALALEHHRQSLREEDRARVVLRTRDATGGILFDLLRAMQQLQADYGAKRLDESQARARFVSILAMLEESFQTRTLEFDEADFVYSATMVSQFDASSLPDRVRNWMQRQPGLTERWNIFSGRLLAAYLNSLGNRVEKGAVVCLVSDSARRIKIQLDGPARERRTPLFYDETGQRLESLRAGFGDSDLEIEVHRWDWLFRPGAEEGQAEGLDLLFRYPQIREVEGLVLSQPVTRIQGETRVGERTLERVSDSEEVWSEADLLGPVLRTNETEGPANDNAIFPSEAAEQVQVYAQVSGEGFAGELLITNSAEDLRPRAIGDGGSGKVVPFPYSSRPPRISDPSLDVFTQIVENNTPANDAEPRAVEAPSESNPVRPEELMMLALPASGEGHASFGFNLAMAAAGAALVYWRLAPLERAERLSAVGRFTLSVLFGLAAFFDSRSLSLLLPVLGMARSVRPVMASDFALEERKVLEEAIRGVRAEDALLRVREEHLNQIANMLDGERPRDLSLAVEIRDAVLDFVPDGRSSAEPAARSGRSEYSDTRLLRVWRQSLEILGLVLEGSIQHSRESREVLERRFHKAAERMVFSAENNTVSPRTRDEATALRGRMLALLEAAYTPGAKPARVRAPKASRPPKPSTPSLERTIEREPVRLSFLSLQQRARTLARSPSSSTPTEIERLGRQIAESSREASSEPGALRKLAADLYEIYYSFEIQTHENESNIARFRDQVLQNLLEVLARLSPLDERNLGLAVAAITALGTKPRAFEAFLSPVLERLETLEEVSNSPKNFRVFLTRLTQLAANGEVDSRLQAQAQRTLAHLQERSAPSPMPGFMLPFAPGAALGGGALQHILLGGLAAWGIYHALEGFEQEGRISRRVRVALAGVAACVAAVLPGEWGMAIPLLGMAVKRRGSSRSSSPRSPIEIYNDLKETLKSRSSEGPANRVLERASPIQRPQPVTNLDWIPRTMRMAKSILEARAQEMGVPVKDVHVVVAGHGGQPMEVFLWLKLGARVTAVDTPMGNEILAPWMERFPHDSERFSLATPGNVEQGDIVAWSHPSGPLFLTWGMQPEHLFGYLKDDGIIIIQSDQMERVIDPFGRPPLNGEFDPLFYERAVGTDNYFFPSPQIRFHRVSSLLIARRIGAPTEGALVRYQERVPVWWPLLHIVWEPIRDVLKEILPAAWFEPRRPGRPSDKNRGMLPILPSALGNGDGHVYQHVLIGAVAAVTVYRSLSGFERTGRISSSERVALSGLVGCVAAVVPMEWMLALTPVFAMAMQGSVVERSPRPPRTMASGVWNPPSHLGEIEIGSLGFGEVLRRARLARNRKLKQLTEDLAREGYDADNSTISLYETRPRYKIPLPFLEACAKYFGWNFEAAVFLATRSQLEAHPRIKGLALTRTRHFCFLGEPFIARNFLDLAEKDVAETSFRYRLLVAVSDVRVRRSIEEIAEACELTPTMIKKYIEGAQPSPDNIQKLARALGVKIELILEGLNRDRNIIQDLETLGLPAHTWISAHGRDLELLQLFARKRREKRLKKDIVLYFRYRIWRAIKDRELCLTPVQASRYLEEHEGFVRSRLHGHQSVNRENLADWVYLFRSLGEDPENIVGPYLEQLGISPDSFYWAFTLGLNGQTFEAVAAAAKISSDRLGVLWREPGVVALTLRRAVPLMLALPHLPSEKALAAIEEGRIACEVFPEIIRAGRAELHLSPEDLNAVLDFVFPTVLRVAMEAKKINSPALARAIGVDEVTVRDYLRLVDRRPGDEVLVKIAEVLEIPIRLLYLYFHPELLWILPLRNPKTGKVYRLSALDSRVGVLAKRAGLAPERGREFVVFDPREFLKSMEKEFVTCSSVRGKWLDAENEMKLVMIYKYTEDLALKCRVEEVIMRAYDDMRVGVAKRFNKGYFRRNPTKYDELYQETYEIIKDCLRLFEIEQGYRLFSYVQRSLRSALARWCRARLREEERELSIEASFSDEDERTLGERLQYGDEQYQEGDPSRGTDPKFLQCLERMNRFFETRKRPELFRDVFLGRLAQQDRTRQEIADEYEVSRKYVELVEQEIRSLAQRVFASFATE